jgi:glutamyl-tRNA reductase
MLESKELYLLGVSFRTAPAAVREALSFAENDLRSLLHAAVVQMPAREAVVVSTCNRTEFYLAAAPDSGAVEAWMAHLRQIRPNAPILRKECHLYQLQGTAVANHLFRVACGLDSAILGDAQILGQVKESLRIASSCGSLGRYLHRVFDQAREAGKRARRETAISSGAAGIGSALAGLVVSRHALRPDDSSTVLIIGAGETAQSITRHLTKRGSWRFLFLNRTEAKAHELANQYGGSARPWTDLEISLAEADIVVAATAAPQPLLSRHLLESVVRERSKRPLLVVDAGLPRNVEPGAQVDLIDIDAIREQQEKTRGIREAAVPAVEKIIEEELRAWISWQAARPLEETIKRLYQHATHHRREMARQLAGSNVMALDQADRIVWRSLRHTLHLHVRQLRELGTEPGKALMTNLAVG